MPHSALKMVGFAQHWLQRFRKNPISCHSERSEESLLVFSCLHVNRREILRFAQNDKTKRFSEACSACRDLQGMNLIQESEPGEMKPAGRLPNQIGRIFVGHGFQPCREVRSLIAALAAGRLAQSSLIAPTTRLRPDRCQPGWYSQFSAWPRPQKSTSWRPNS